MDFDAIVVGSGMSGGWAAKELTERGLKTLVIERGWKVTHGEDYLDYKQPWELDNRGRMPEEEWEKDYHIQKTCYAFTTANKQFWVKDSEHPYETPEGRPFHWLRGYHLGGRSLLWARHSYRWSEMDFEANSKDGHGVDWPIRYRDMAPWYDHVERFAGICGERRGLAHLPDGIFQPAMGLTAAEKHFKASIERTYPGRTLMMGRIAHLTAPTEEQEALGRGRCQQRDLCYRGCSFGAYFSSLSATLPAAERTGNLTVVTGAIGHSVIYDPATGRAKGVRVIDAETKEGRTYEGKVIFLCASAIASAQILLNSASEEFPTGLVNRSDQVGRNLMDHITGIGASGRLPGYMDRYYEGRRPGGFYIPRYRNLPGREPESDFVRGFGYQGGGARETWNRGVGQAGVGADFKQSLREPGAWTIGVGGFGEMLPRPDNRVTLHATRKDKWGVPVLNIDCSYGPNDLQMSQRIADDIVEMLEAAGCEDITPRRPEPLPPGYGIHEMGTARMGRDPATSVLNGWCQAHDAQNLFVTDGAAMASSACQNPSLTYMAMSARAANHAADLLKEGAL
jgi:choline dehydrogenase-like flavoprotein